MYILNTYTHSTLTIYDNRLVFKAQMHNPFCRKGILSNVSKIENGMTQLLMMPGRALLSATQGGRAYSSRSTILLVSSLFHRNR